MQLIDVGDYCHIISLSGFTREELQVGWQAVGEPMKNQCERETPPKKVGEWIFLTPGGPKGGESITPLQLFRQHREVAWKKIGNKSISLHFGCENNM